MRTPGPTLSDSLEGNRLPALVLFFTPFITVELLTGNTPLAVYLTPPALIVGNLIYGGVLILIRETVVRWGKGRFSVLILACGYGLLNEGLGSKGFFDPHFYAVRGGGLEGFGRVFGINVPWALNISIFHAVFSVMVPLTLVSTIFPGTCRWVGDRLYAALLILVAAAVAFAFWAFDRPYRYDEGRGPMLLVLGLMALVIVLAGTLPEPRLRRWDVRIGAPALFALGVASVFAFAVLPHVVRAATNSPTVYVAFLLTAFVLTPGLLVLKLPEPTARGRVALCAGLFVPLVLHGVGLLPGKGAGPGSAAATIVVFILLGAAFARAPGGATSASK